MLGLLCTIHCFIKEIRPDHLMKLCTPPSPSPLEPPLITIADTTAMSRIFIVLFIVRESCSLHIVKKNYAIIDLKVMYNGYNSVLHLI